MKKIRVGTRKSALAKTQTQWVVNQLTARGLNCEIIEIQSQGDKDRSKPLYEIESEGPGLFTKRLEEGLLNNEIDLAVHSLKDLPTLQPPELAVLAVPERENPSDVLICRREKVDAASPWGIAAGSSIGTSSLRREALLLSEASITAHSIRGNVPTRVQAVVDGKFDAVVLAQAGLKRLAFQLPNHVQMLVLDDSKFVSAPGQGALAVEGRKNLEPHVLEVVGSLNHAPSAEEVRWERHILRELEGGCTLPLGVRCRRNAGWELFVFLGMKNESAGQRTWSAFHHRAWKGAEIQPLVGEAISHFLGILGKGRRK